MPRPELVPPRTLSAPVTAAAPHYRPWYEVTARVEVRVVEWGWHEASWHHWAVPVGTQGAELGAVREFDPGRRAARPGEPERVRIPSPPLDSALAGGLAEALLATLPRVVYRQEALGLVSSLGERREAFRRRCFAVVAPAVRSGGLAGDGGATTVATVRQGIEERHLDEKDLEVGYLRVGIGWYPDGTEPGLASSELLVVGPVRGADA